MAFDPLTAGLQLGQTLIERLVPDKSQQDAAKLQLATMAANGELQTALGQIGIDQTEAQSAVGTKAALVQFFVAGWRPAIGWMCGMGLLWQYFLAPLLGFIAQGHHVPVIDSSSLNDLLIGLLGLAGMRSYDKVKGTGNGQ